ncbi:TraB/GumN family protein [uncultured Treponema sp.]|uniref:TraB/GumN family protein n=1 Tax=uncultured Treponema sp. TaxID=162155 RepID=UPI002627CCA0|nr:TraB/GumN family protein [uncultured Treponema sp.]
MSQTEKVLKFDDREIILIGTAHISQESCNEVKKAVEEKSPDCVAIELDEGRYKSLNNPEDWKNLDIVKVLKANQGFLLLANLVLSGFQRRMGSNVGVKPGDEMRAADNCAKERNIPVAMVDRPIQITLRRAWAVNSFWGKCKLISALLASAFDKEEVSGEQIEILKNSSEMDSLMKELADYMPVVKKVLIDERDRYLASKIWDCKGKKTLAVLGAGHLPGVEAYLKELAAGKKSSDVSDISEVPPKKVGSKIAGWTIAALIVALIAAGFVYGGITKGAQLLGAWVVWNSTLAGLGAILAFGHPLAVLTAIVGAPFTSLCPLVGVGLFTGLVQAAFCKPKVSDMETLQDDLTLKGFYKNRILRVLLVFFLSSLGSSIGTFAAGANFAVVIAEFAKGLFKK